MIGGHPRRVGARKVTGVRKRFDRHFFVSTSGDSARQKRRVCVVVQNRKLCATDMFLRTTHEFLWKIRYRISFAHRVVRPDCHLVHPVTVATGIF